MHNKENLRFIQIHAAAVSVERPALSLPASASLIFPAYARLSLPHIDPFLSGIVACLPYLAMNLVIF